jgi:hypothetical protein
MSFCNGEDTGNSPARKRADVRLVPDCEKIMKTLYEESS